MEHYKLLDEYIEQGKELNRFIDKKMIALMEILKIYDNSEDKEKFLKLVGEELTALTSTLEQLRKNRTLPSSFTEPEL